MNIIWSPEAIQDLISLRAYIAEESPTSARRVALRILHDVEDLLPENPHMGRPGRVPGTRELVIPQTPYMVPYRIQHNAIQILRVYHGSRRWPDSFQMGRLPSRGS
jgi:toxin ParE1/3/4